MSTVHSDYRLDYLGRPLSRLTYGTINTLALRKLDYRIGVSDAMVDLLISRKFDPERLFSIYNGLDFTPRTPAMNRAEYLRSVGLEADETCVVAGIAARLNPVKDIATLIRGFAKAHRAFPALRLLIAGDGEEMANLKQLAADLGVAKEVCFAGWISDTDSFYNALDINTLTSISETFPYALTEGARAGLPTISSKVGGVSYLIDHGSNGFLFPPGEDQALADHLLTLARDPDLRKTMGQRLYEKAKREFSIEATVQRQLEIYDSILRYEKNGRDRVVICGAYGRGNAGDDAILLAILTELRSIESGSLLPGFFPQSHGNPSDLPGQRLLHLPHLESDLLFQAGEVLHQRRRFPHAGCHFVPLPVVLSVDLGNRQTLWMPCHHVWLWHRPHPKQWKPGPGPPG